jgi:hypothetical protein
MQGEDIQGPMAVAIEGGHHPQSKGLSSKKDYDHHPEQDQK